MSIYCIFHLTIQFSSVTIIGIDVIFDAVLKWYTLQNLFILIFLLGFGLISIQVQIAILSRMNGPNLIPIVSTVCFTLNFLLSRFSFLQQDRLPFPPLPSSWRDFFLFLELVLTFFCLIFLLLAETYCFIFLSSEDKKVSFSCSTEVAPVLWFCFPIEYLFNNSCIRVSSSIFALLQ